MPSKLWAQYCPLYQAEDLSEGIRAIFSIIPPSILVGGICIGLTGYLSHFKLRKMLGVWRRREREKLINEQYILLRSQTCSRDASPSPQQKPPVTEEEFHELAASFQIMLPQDQDMFAELKQLLFETPLTPGWELCQTHHGLRFWNRRTHEIALFHPNIAGKGQTLQRIVEERRKKAFQQSHEPTIKEEVTKLEGVSGEGWVGASALFDYFLLKEREKLQKEVTESLHFERRDQSYSPNR